MKNKSVIFVVLISFLASACGSQNYDDEQEKPAPPATTTTASKPQQPIQNVRPIEKSLTPGYLWRGFRLVGMSDETLSALQCPLRDAPGVNHFEAFGSSLFWGAILGVVIRFSDSWFLGKPVETGEGHWFWNNLDQTVRKSGQGLIRGAIFAGVCETLLAGGNFTPFNGILGQDFVALSAGLSVGGLSAIAATPLLSRYMEKQEEPPITLKEDDPSNPISRRIISQLNQWSKTSEIGQRFRYRVAPGLVLLGIGAGFGLLVYDHLQSSAQGGDWLECRSNDRDWAQGAR